MCSYTGLLAHQLSSTHAQYIALLYNACACTNKTRASVRHVYLRIISEVEAHVAQVHGKRWMRARRFVLWVSLLSCVDRVRSIHVTGSCAGRVRYI